MVMEYGIYEIPRYLGSGVCLVSYISFLPRFESGNRARTTSCQQRPCAECRDALCSLLLYIPARVLENRKPIARRKTKEASKRLLQNAKAILKNAHASNHNHRSSMGSGRLQVQEPLWPHAKVALVVLRDKEDRRVVLEATLLHEVIAG